MAARMVGGLGVLGAGGYMAYSMMSGSSGTPETLTPDQKRTRKIRSHLSGHHPKMAGGDDCLSRGAGQLKSHASGGDSHVGEGDRRTAVGGSVSVK